MSTLMVVCAHPDDESFSGGVLARYAAEGVRTVLVTCTGGEAGEISDPALASPDNLGEVRARELAESAKALGISRTVALGYRDSGMAGTPENQRPDSFFQADLGEAVGRLLEVMREERPEVVICPNEHGDYGHPDHIKAHQVAKAAFPKSGAKKLYYTAFPRSAMKRFAETMKELGDEDAFTDRELVDPEGKPVEMGTPDELVTTEIDVAAYAHMARASMEAHKTQFGPDSVMFKLPAERWGELWSHGYYVLAEGPRGAPEGQRETDLFSGL